MTDINEFRDIVKLVDTFYDKVDNDPVLSPYFNDIAKVDWYTHKEKLYRFWESILFRKASYKGQPFYSHLKLGRIHEADFGHWLKLFTETVDEHFKGKTAEQAKKSAGSIAHVLMIKLNVITDRSIKTVE